MKYPAVFVMMNIFFIKIGESSGTDVPPKYLYGCSSGIITPNIWTREEILNKYPNALPCKSLLDLKEVWDSQR